MGPRIDATIHRLEGPPIDLDGATVGEIEAAASPTDPFGMDQRAQIVVLGAQARVHLCEDPVAGIAKGRCVYQVLGTAKAATGWTAGRLASLQHPKDDR